MPPTLQQQEMIDLREILRVLWRRKAVILGITILLTITSAVLVLQLTPLYTARALVMIEPQDTKVVDIEAVVSGLPADLETVHSEAEVMRSRELADRVIRELRLDEVPELNPGLRPASMWKSLLDPDRYLPAAWKEAIFGSSALAELDALERAEVQRAAIVDAFLERLTVSPHRQTRVIEVAFTSERPALARRVANKLADLYLLQQLEASYEATRRATAWLNERLAGLKQKVEASEQAVEEYRASSGLVKGEGSTIASQQFSELNTQLVLARSERAEAEARLRQVENLLDSTGGVESAAEVLSSPLIQRLREQEAEVVRRIAELSSEYGDKHPRMIKVRAEARDLREKIGSEVRKIVQNLRNEVSVARARERTLKQSLDELESSVAGLNAREVELRALEREAKANRLLYETFLSRFKETGAQQDLKQTDARIISRADIPTVPSFPRPQLFIALALVGSLILGVLVAFVIEQLDAGFRSTEQVERITGVRPLALIPIVGALRKAPERYIVERPVSAYGEAIRTLHTSLLLSSVDKPAKCVLVTSALPKEGKTTISVSLSRMLARSGHKALVIEADLRRPQVAGKMGVDKEPGLVELLSGRATVRDVLRRDELSGADVIPAGETTPNAADLLSSDRMRALLDELCRRYDLVVLDSPPALAVADVKVLAQLTDRIVFVIRWAATRREVAMSGIKQISDAGAEVSGVALTMVDVRKHAYYGYGDSGYYYGLTKSYYTS